MTIQESCSCGATLVFTDDSKYGNYIDYAQLKFQRAYASCRPKPTKSSEENL